MAEVQSPTTERAEKEPEVVAHHHDSEEYESAEEIYEEEEEIEEVEVEEEEEEGAEAAGERDLDDDEDRKNPQFIPKKGYFYEHDDRTQADEEDAEAEKEEVVKEQKPKKTGKEGSDRWTHDLYNENEQAGKSKDEIVAIYGYDIRADDTPPKAVRRRRYGRDPRKYTRKSDDAEGNRRPRGGYRGGRGRRGGGSEHREHDDRGYEEEFPSLSKPVDRGDSQRDFGRDGRDRDSNRGRSDSRGGRGGGRGGERGGGGKPAYQRPNRAFQNDGEPGDGYGYRENKNFGGDRGGRGGGRGRRNEFTNRNRYRDRQENTNDSGVSGGRPIRNEPNVERRDNRYDNRRSEHDDRGGRITNGSSGVDRPRNDPSGSRPPKPAVVAPFTNTEYTGSASLTAQSNATVSSSVPALKSDLHRSLNGTDVEQQKPGDSKPDLRRGQSKPFQSDRRSQMPPRLMQQQQQSDQPIAQTGKPKKFSTQRQRQVVDAPVQQASVPSQMIPQMGPVQTPVVTGSSNMVPSPVPNYTPQQPYFEPGPGNFEAQVYDSAGSPMTGSGPSVSPSLWGPHAAAFATAPYPSPPTGTQVQVQQQPYGDPAAMYAATQPPGPTIYAAPPQFIQDPTLLNFAPPPGPQYGAPFHPQGFQGYAPVTPAPPPEVYHAGVTYYNTHNQMQRPPVVAVQKRPKTVLQLVEPPEKVKSGKDTQQPTGGGKTSDFESSSNTISDNGQYGEYESSDAVIPEQADAELVSKFDNLQTTDKRSELKIEASLNSPSQSQPESWASQVDQMSPTEKVPPHSLESAVADQANQETSPSSISASNPPETQEVSDAKVSAASKVETEPSSAAGEHRTETASESVETVKSPPEEAVNSQEKASTPDTSAPAQDGVPQEN